MAGIEQIVVHSKSYVIRWVQVADKHTISWSLQPQKKSINFGIFKHPGTKSGLLPTIPAADTIDAGPWPAATDGLPEKVARRGSANTSSIVDRLESIGMKLVSWTGKCSSDRVSIGRYDVPSGESGMYGLVFDNTFSKQTSKTVNLVLMSHHVDTPPKSGHHLHHSQAFSDLSNAFGKNASPVLNPTSDSNESLPLSGLQRITLDDSRPPSKGKGADSKGTQSATFYTGVLSKKRRKKGQGFAKRFFSLDFTSSTLSYYLNRHSSALRGAVPLSLAVIGVNEKTREFSVDSGVEVWHLRAPNRKDFDGWRDALERASSAVSPVSLPPTPSKSLRDVTLSRTLDPAEELEWARVEQLVSKVAGTRDAVRTLAKDTDPKYLPSPNGAALGLSTSRGSSNAPSPSSYEASKDYFPDIDETAHDRRPFWKRRPSERQASAERRPAALFKRSVSAQLAIPYPSTLPSPLTPTSPGPLDPAIHQRSGSALPLIPDNRVHERCMALLRDLDSAVSDFASLVAESRARRLPPLNIAHSRLSLDSIDDQEFFDADDGVTRSLSQLLDIGRPGEVEDVHEEPLFDHDSEAESDVDSEDGDVVPTGYRKSMQLDGTALIPSLPRSLPPLPLSKVQRRSSVLQPKHSPPSIIGFLRKNAGKDLSDGTISMPVTANEPTSLLQRLAESMEYSFLLDSAASVSLQPAERLMYVSAFAISFLAYNRAKERAVRKPFNPLLGETFELVQEDLGFRFLAEKVSHHPVQMACQADSLKNGGWSFTQSPRPTSSFWGKSVELNTEGRAHVVLYAPNEQYSWSQATCFLRNVIAGEKYVEPVQRMTIVNETNGTRAVATFKAGGMFSGRSEEVNVQLFDPAIGDAPLPLNLAGKWTESLKRSDSGALIWSAGSLVPDAARAYGFTSFAATLNEITQIEDGHLPPTDSRLRPDQRALEQSRVEEAEAVKAKLEERQRARRKVLESHGQTYQPQFFERSGQGDERGAEVWRLIEKDGYWERRQRGDWSGVQKIFET